MSDRVVPDPHTLVLVEAMTRSCVCGIAPGSIEIEGDLWAEDTRGYRTPRKTAEGRSLARWIDTGWSGGPDVTGPGHDRPTKRWRHPSDSRSAGRQRGLEVRVLAYAADGVPGVLVVTG